MKKIALLFVCAFSVLAFAQKAQVSSIVSAKKNFQVAKDYSAVKNAQQQPAVVLPTVTPEMLSTVQKSGEKAAVTGQNLPIMKAAQINKEAEAPFYALFDKPAGTFFCGIDQNGTYVWFNYPSLVGAWKNGLTEWTYQNGSSGADEIQWYGRLYNRYPQYYSVNSNGDLVDSVVQFYPWGGSTILPALYATRTVNDVQEKDSFVLLGYPGDPIDTTLASTLVWNGFVNPLSDDGTFPLTKAMVLNSATGMDYSSMFVWNTDSATKSWSYLYGTEPLQYNDTLTVEAAGLLVAYDKPQAPLFVKEISMAINALTYVADSAKYYYTKPTFNKLGVTILSSDLKTVYAQTTCAIADVTANKYFPGYMAHFSFEEKDPYGTVISEGITLKDAFVVMLSGLDQEGANFGIVSSYNPYYNAGTYVIDTAYNIQPAIANFDPYIMLNGSFYTLEDYSELFGYENYGDTYNMIAKYNEQYEAYYLVHADGDLKGYPDVILAATEMLYDTVTYQYNYQIIAPDWANVIDMDWYAGSTDVWYNYNTYFLYIEGYEEYMEEGTELPKVGDEIILSKFGRELVFKVVEVDGPQGIESVSSYKGVETKKAIRDGQLIIERNGVKYNATGAKL